MKKITSIFATLALLSTMSVSAQTTKPTTDQRVASLETKVQSLKNEKKTMQSEINEVQSKLIELADRNAEYKKALDIKQTLNATDADGYQYGFVSAIGDSKTDSLVITLNMFNPGETREKQLAQAQFVTYDGNAFNTYEFQWGSLDYQKATIDANTNMKVRLFYARIPKGTKRINSLTIKAYSSTWGNSDMTINFRDLPVEWK